VAVRNPAHKETQPEVDPQALCEQALDVIGQDTVTRSHLSVLPPWFLDNALDEELDNWSETVETGTWETFADLDSPNVITSHVSYKVKTDEAGKHKLRARLVLLGNKEQAADDIRSDAASIHFFLIRMILTIAAMINFELAGVDAKNAYHQSGRAPRNILVRPPAECLAGRRSLGRLLHLPYGLVDAGRQRQLAFERRLLDIIGFVTVPSMPHVFMLFDLAVAFICL
jgi:hypothetical protein